MSIKIQSFGGYIGWMARKKIPHISSWAFTNLNFVLRRKKTLKFINHFNDFDIPPPPLSVNIETINRCNGSCNFCPCNINVERRPFKKMSRELFEKVILQLVKYNFKGRIIININNEPFMDDRIIEWAKHIRNNLPKNNIYVITNGTLLSVDKFKQIAPFLNKMTINNYSNEMKLHKNINELVKHINKNENEYEHIMIDIQFRYLNEVLSNRNGTSPNKQSKKMKLINEPCLEPYTAMYIYPDGTVGLCCFDALEKIKIGNIDNNSIEEIWNSKEYNDIRKKMIKRRSGNEFCKYCDGFSKESRADLIKYVSQ